MSPSLAPAKNKEIVVLYDGMHHCMDGLCGAWVCWKRFGARAAYIPSNHDEAFLSRLKGKTVYCVDISYGAETMERLRRQNKQLIAFDHHLDKKDSIRRATIYRFSTKHCGCMLAWKYFFPGKPIPKLLRYVEDLDFWRFTRPHSQEITLALSLRALSLSIPEVGALVRAMDDPDQFRAMVQGAKSLVALKGLCVRQVMENAELCKWGTHRVFVASCPEFLRSEVGHALARKGVFGCTYYISDGEYAVSLRSSGAFDVSKFAARYGGGGHRKAAGFTWPRHKRLPFCVIPYRTASHG